jgi:hypothetical protein
VNAFSSRPRAALALLFGAVALATLAGGVAATGSSAGGLAVADGGQPTPLASAAGSGPDASTAQDDPLIKPCATEMPEDYEDPAGGTADTIGWVDGYWYDEPIDVDASDGLSEGELERLTARTAARAEALRCLTFEDGVPPVEVVTRAELGNRTGQQFANVTDDQRRFDNAVLSTQLFVGETNDSVDVREDARTQTVAGYYDIQGDRIVVVEREGEGSAVDETVLTHEVAHALQDQNFGIQRPGNVTTDRDAGLLGLVEGDASWIEYRYLDRCEQGRWAESCVTLESAGGGGDGTGDGDGGGDGASTEPPNWGLYLQQYQPYSDGPSFVRSIHDDGGWAAVNELYDEPPTSALYTVFPDTYGDVDLAEPTVEERDRGEWERIELEGGPDHERVGPAGIGSMVIAPTYETGGRRNVISPTGILNYEDGEVSQFDPLNYDQPPVTGWRGDRMAVFADGNASATVWRSAWTDGEEAREFADAYERLLKIHDATAVEDRNGVYRFEDGSEHAGAAAVLVEGENVRIVTAPSVAALGDVSPAVAEASEDDGAAIADELPGFGIVAALVAIVAVVAQTVNSRGRSR